MPSLDTSPEADAVQLRVWRAMTGEQRLLLAFEMCDYFREVAKSRIRHEHPDWTEWQVTRELLRIAFLPDPLPPGLPE